MVYWYQLVSKYFVSLAKLKWFAVQNLPSCLQPKGEAIHLCSACIATKAYPPRIHQLFGYKDKKNNYLSTYRPKLLY